MITYERVREVFHYDLVTGLFTWKINKKAGKAGQEAGTLTEAGYVQVQIDSKQYPAHRLIWLWMTGKFPKEFIDHKDGFRTNNSWLNLREASPKVNQQNQRRAHKRSTTGLLGVSNHPRGYQALINVEGRSKYLGTYTTPEEAHDVYIKAKRQYHEGNTL